MIIKDPNYAHEYYGMSTDTKPLSVPNASLFYEIDTCDIYMFDEDGKQWFKQSGGSGSSSGSGGSGSSSGSAANVMIVNPVEKHRTVEATNMGSSGPDTTLKVTRSVLYDKTWQEVHDALAAGIQVLVNVDFLMENEIEATFILNSSNDIDDLYERLFGDILYAQASNNEQPATLHPITGTFVRSTVFTEIDTETSDTRYDKEYMIDALMPPQMSFDFFVTDNSSDGAIYCYLVLYYDIPSDYNSELDDAYDQWLNGGGSISDTPGTQEQDESDNPES